jgi:crossover junction endodeoxyribonuclease RuvC
VIRILGLDPSLSRTGWGLIGAEGSRLRHLAHGAIPTRATDPLPVRLKSLHGDLCALLAAHAPDEAAVEEVFVNRNAQSTLKLGQARGVVLLAVGHLPVAEHATRLVKKAVVGTGAAEKAQVAAMVQRLLPGCGPLGEDEADALAVAIAHAHLRAAPGIRGQQEKAAAPGIRGQQEKAAAPGIRGQKGSPAAPGIRGQQEKSTAA